MSASCTTPRTKRRTLAKEHYLEGITSVTGEVVIASHSYLLPPSSELPVVYCAPSENIYQHHYRCTLCDKTYLEVFVDEIADPDRFLGRLWDSVRGKHGEL